jgi:hypothetical protein
MMSSEFYKFRVQAEAVKDAADAGIDVATAKGMAAAVSTRAAYRNILARVEAERRSLKESVIKRAREIDGGAAEAAEAIAGMMAPLDAVIKAEEDKKEAARKQRKAVADARVKGFRDRIAKLYSIAVMMVNETPERIKQVIADVEATKPAGFEEFSEEAAAAREYTLTALRQLLTAKTPKEES